jgi:hypothetical protein
MVLWKEMGQISERHGFFIARGFEWQFGGWCRRGFDWQRLAAQISDTEKF